MLRKEELVKIKAASASTYKDKENGWSYSESALMELAESAKGIPVIYKKNRVGTIDAGKCENRRLIVFAEVEKKAELLNRKYFLVPGGLTDFVTNGDIIERCIAHQYFLTEEPSDQTLTPFDIVN